MREVNRVSPKSFLPLMVYTDRLNSLIIFMLSTQLIQGSDRGLDDILRTRVKLYFHYSAILVLLCWFGGGGGEIFKTKQNKANTVYCMS